MREAAYEPNNRTTWDKVCKSVELVVNPYVGDGTLNSAKVLVSENNEQTIEANEFRLSFCWKKNEADEWTVVRFKISPDGISVK